LTIWLGSGLAVWWIGQEGTLHIGMSGVIYGLAFFLISSAIFIRHRVAVLIAVFVVVLYGSMAEGFLPKEGVSWQSHLAGALCGVISALVFGRLDRQYKTRDEEDERDVRFFEETGNSQWGGP
ncbi:MAG: rhomboid family intramembrane serine protease, partial [Chitinophagales bacterium]|nr:rhomboid family intramembrane serine protease [Chitinophagales bacterium]